MKPLLTLMGLGLTLLALWNGWGALMEFRAADMAGLVPAGPADPMNPAPGVLAFGGALLMLAVGIGLLTGGLMMEGRKRCVACRESIPARATKCRYCGTAQHG